MRSKIIPVLALVFLFTILFSTSISAYQLEFDSDDLSAFSDELKKNLESYESDFWSWTNSKNFIDKGEHGKIEIDGPLGIGNTKAEYELQENTDTCLYNCRAKGKATLYTSGPLFTGLSIKDLDEGSVKASVFIKEEETYEEPLYDERVVGTSENGTEITETYQSGTETKTREVWKEYNGRELSAGTYEWKIEGEKEQPDNVDWIASAFGKSFDEWAWWNSTYDLRYPHNANGSGYDGIGYFGANKTGWYGTINNSGNSGQIFTYNDRDTNDLAVANETDEFCWFQTETENFNCPRQTGSSSGLVSYYTLDDNDTSSNARDYIGGNDGTWNGNLPTQVSGQVGNAQDFDGSSDYVDISDFGDSSSELTLNAWVNPDSVSGKRVILGKDDDSSGRSWNLYIEDGEAGFEIHGSHGIFTAGSVSDTQGWVLITGTWDGSTARVYINGSQAGSTSSTGSINDVNSLVNIGRRSFSGSEDYFDGQIDDVRIYNRSLSSTEVNNLYQSTNQNFPYWGQEEYLGPINIDLLKPIQNKVLSSTDVNFSANVTHDNNNLKNVSLYIDGTKRQTDSTGTNKIYNFSENITTIGNHTWYVNATDGQNVSVSNTRNFEIDINKPIVNLSEPANDSKLTKQKQSFKFNVSNKSQNSQVSNASLIINGSVNKTITDIPDDVFCSTDPDCSQFGSFEDSKQPIVINQTLSDGPWNWSAQIAMDSGIISQANETRIFEIDSNNPNVSVENKTLIDHGYEGKNETFEYNVSDPNVDSCWFNYNGTNQSTSCSGDNFTISLEKDNYNLTFYANDTFGNENSEFEEWNYKLFENQQLYNGEILNDSTNTDTVEGANNQYLANITTPSSVDFSTAEFVYNDSAKSPGDVTSNGNFIFNKSFIVPDVSSQTTFEFGWNVSMSDGSEIELLSHNQTVDQLQIDACNSFSTKILEYNLKDEDNRTEDVTGNESIDVAVELFSEGTEQQFLNFSKQYNSNTAEVCIDDNLNSTAYDMDATAEYQADDYQTERNNILEFKLDNSTIPKTQDLLDLKSDRATDFTLVFKDDSFTRISEALITVKREYVAADKFIEVESPVTDDNGQAVASLVAKDGTYRIEVRKDGELLAVFDRISAVCENEVTGQCEVNLNAFSSDFELDNFLKYKNLNYNMKIDRNNTEISTEFSTIDGSTANVSLRTEVVNRFDNKTACTDSLESSLGTLTCDYGSQFSNSTITGILEKDGEVIQTKTFAQAPNTGEIFGSGRVVLLLVMLMIIPFMFIASLVGMVIGAIVGLVLATILFVTTGSASLGLTAGVVWLIISGGILIWKINQGGRGV